MPAESPNFDPTRARLTELIAKYRLFARDDARSNIQLEAEESSDRQVAAALIRYLSWWNGRPPFLGRYTPTTFPDVFEHMWLDGAAVLLLEGIIVAGLRNYATWSDGGINFSTESKLGPLMSYTSQMRQRCQAEMDAAKASQNIELALGCEGSFSEYALINSAVPNYIMGSNP